MTEPAVPELILRAVGVGGLALTERRRGARAAHFTAAAVGVPCT